MIYILILVLTGFGGSHGVTSAEFNSEMACRAAIETIKSESSKNKDGVSIRGAYCVAKEN